MELSRSASVKMPLSKSLDHDRWPFLFWVYVKTLGLYRHGMFDFYLILILMKVER